MKDGVAQVGFNGRARLYGHALSPRPYRIKSGFTLIEVMIVVAIIGLMAMISVPSIYHAMHPESLHKAVNDVAEACEKARARAIWESAPVDLWWNPTKGMFQVMDAPKDVAPVDPDAPPAPEPTPKPTESENKGSTPITGQLSDRIGIDMLDVNFRECKNDDEARVRFYPNGTCDEFTIILHSLDTGESKKITLELVTSLPEVSQFP